MVLVSKSQSRRVPSSLPLSACCRSQLTSRHLTSSWWPCNSANIVPCSKFQSRNTQRLPVNARWFTQSTCAHRTRNGYPSILVDASPVSTFHSLRVPSPPPQRARMCLLRIIVNMRKVESPSDPHCGLSPPVVDVASAAASHKRHSSAKTLAPSINRCSLAGTPVSFCTRSLTAVTGSTKGITKLATTLPAKFTTSNVTMSDLAGPFLCRFSLGAAAVSAEKFSSSSGLITVTIGPSVDQKLVPCVYGSLRSRNFLSSLLGSSPDSMFDRRQPL
mmetsp:Transcript_44402/g.78073  ORF Transcript_44402/g.78073 Transcript_44402/m.78073 type:complete len:274 (+) Transcript_44402:644-1465(+)